MQPIAHDVRFALRSLAKAPAFAAVVVATLGLGIGANVAMFGTMQAALIRALPFEDPDRLVMAQATYNDNINWIASAQDYADYRDRSRSFASLSAITGMSMRHTITGGDEAERVSGTWVSVDLFSTLGITPRIGRLFSEDEAVTGAPYVVLISDSYWRQRFAEDPGAIGSTLVIDGDPHVIVGVMPAGFRFLQDVDLWRPMRLGSGFASARRFHNWMIVGRLAPGATMAGAQADVDAIARQLEAEYPETNRGWGLLVVNLHDVMAGDYRASLLLLMASVGLVLLIACGNVAGLLLARGSTRQLELSVRVALGASRLRLIRQLLTESLVLAVGAGVVGTVLAVLAQGLIVQSIPMERLGIRDVPLSGSMLLFAVGISLATGILFGIVPALRFARTNVAEGIKSGASAIANGAGLRNVLVVLQVGVSVILLVGSGLLIRSFAALRATDPGFASSNLVTAEIQLPRATYGEPERRIQFFTTVLEEVGALPGVTAAGLINQLPIRDPGNNMGAYAADNPPADPTNAPSAYRRAVLPGYFATMQIPLLAGRGIEQGDRRGAPDVIVINSTMASILFGEENPIGREVVVDVASRETAEVVGVVGDVRISGLAGAPEPTWYGSYEQIPYTTMRIAIRTNTEVQAIERGLRDIVRRFGRDIPVADVATMDDIVGGSITSPRTMAVSIGLFASVALLLAAVGLYGVLAYQVNRRFREIGLRVALGARAGDVVGMVLKRGFGLVVLGLGIGVIGALGVTRLMRQQLFGIETTDPLTFVAVAALFLGVALVACLIPARRALRIDPTISLRAE